MDQDNKKRNPYLEEHIKSGGSGSGYHHQRERDYEKGRSRHRKHKPSGHLPDPRDYE